MKFKTDKGYLTYQILTFLISLVSYVLAVQSNDLIISIFIYFVPLPLEILEIITFDSDDNGYNYSVAERKMGWLFYKLNLLLLAISFLIVVMLIFKQFNAEVISFSEEIYQRLPLIYPFKHLFELLVTMFFDYRNKKEEYMHYL